MGKIILIANEKGGAGKTMLAAHLAWAADEAGLRVLAIDTDTQTSLFRRLTGKEAESIDENFGAAHSAVLISPSEYMDDDDYELIVADTKGSDTLSKGPVPDLVVIPINGTDALREANNTIVSIRRFSKTVPIVLVLNRISIGGKHAAEIRSTKNKKMLSNVSVSDLEIGDSRSIWSSEQICAPAWSLPHIDKQATKLRRFCWNMLVQVDLLEYGDADDD